MTITQLKRKVVFYRILIVVIIALSFMWNTALRNNNVLLMEEVEVYKASSTIYKSQAKHWKDKCEHYQSANEALIEYSEPKSLNKAIKATKLPKLIEV